jgi:putative FmdB family regulatory protein
MATYMYRCPECECFDVIVPMASVGPTHDCPQCGRRAQRVFTAPALATLPSGLHRAADLASASSEAPQVVRSIPDGAPRPRQPRWSPFTGAKPVNASRRPAGPHQSLPRL